MLIALFDIADLLLSVLAWIIIIQVILSWLFAFNVLNTRSGAVRSITTALDKLTAPLYRPIRRLIFLAAFLPSPGRSANDQRASEPIDGRVPPTTAEWIDIGENVWMVGPKTATELFFPDATPAVARWATQRLRPQSYRVTSETTPLEAWPDVECRSIVCRDDRAINPAWVRAAARDRLGVEAVEISGGHSPFLTRPVELALALDQLMS